MAHIILYGTGATQFLGEQAAPIPQQSYTL